MSDVDVIRRGYLAVDPILLKWILRESESKPSTRMSAIGEAWHREGHETRHGGYCETVPFLSAVVKLTGEVAAPVLVRWWASVLRKGAEYRAHRHDGKWSFVYHLTEGAAVHFGALESPISFPAEPGQILVFNSDLAHWTDEVTGDAPRVSIAGNLYFKKISPTADLDQQNLSK